METSPVNQLCQVIPIPVQIPGDIGSVRQGQHRHPKAYLRGANNEAITECALSGV